MNRPFRLLAALAPVFIAATAHAGDRPNFNAYAVAPSIGVVRAPLAGARVTSIDKLTGAPTMLFATGAGSKAPSGATTEAAGRKHLSRYAAHYGVSAAAVANAELHHVHDLGRGGIIATYRQRYDGVEVFHHDVKVLMDRSKDLVAIGGNLHAARAPRGARFSIGEAGALAVAFNDLFGKSVSAADFSDNGDRNGDYLHFDLSPRGARASNHVLARPARAKRVWFALPDRLVPAYFLEVFGRTPKSAEAEAYAYVIAADDGRLLYRENLTHHDTFNYRVWADTTGDKRCADGPLVDYTPYQGAPDNGSYPLFNPNPPLIAMDAFNTNPQNQSDPWLPTGATQTTGNNVDAFTAPEGANGFQTGDIRATTTAPNTFDHAFNLLAGPQSSVEQQMAAVTQLFYQTNWMHDYWYDSGFNEAAGNAQTDNFGRGGVSNDVLQAHAQAGAPTSRNNSNMQVPADGSSPIMQMYVWDGLQDRTLTLTPGGQVQNGPADFGPVNFDVTASMVLGNDGVGTTTDACENLLNGAGQIVVVDRGTCTFQSKAVRAQNAGALGIIIIDNVAEQPIDMAGDMSQPAVTIPVLSMTQSDGAALKTSLGAGPVTGDMHRLTSPDCDGTLDNTVSAHEWGHYLHLRQVACSNQQCTGMSEGWADFNALMMIVHPGDDPHGTYPMAVYATAAFPKDPGYFGIRRYPYSVDMVNIDPLTFKYIAQGSGLPPGPPVSDMGDPNNEVHSVGEIWAAMLFEAYVALLDKATGSNPPYNETQAHRRMADYVEGGLQLAPVDPTITEQRDAVLAAAAAADKDDFVAMAKAFARRGAGTCAVSPDRYSTDLTGVMEDFSVAPNATIVSVTVDDKGKSCDNDGYVDVGETGRVVVEVENRGAATLSNAKVKVSATSTSVKFPSGATVSLPDLKPFDTVKAIVDITLADNVTDALAFDVAAELDANQACNTATTSTVAVHANVDEKPKSSSTDDVEAKATLWQPKGDDSKLIWSRIASGKGNHAWSGIDFSSPSDTQLESPTLDVGSAKNFVVSFDHTHDFEQSMGTNWDGSVIEISLDDGVTWQDISAYGDPGYDGTLGDPMANNPLVGRMGYAGKNMSNPDFDHVKIDLGMALANKSVKIRFRIGSDDAQGAPGWVIDNIAFDGITNTPFTSLVPDEGVCTAGTGGSGGGGGGGTNGTGGGPAATGAGGGGGQGTGGTGPESGGCGCELPGNANDTTAPSIALIAALGAMLRRRRRRG